MLATSRPDLSILGQLLASQRLEDFYKRGLRPDWTNDYMGPEQFWGDGWRAHEDPSCSSVAMISDHSTEWDFLVHDPTDVPDVQNLLNSPPLISNKQQSYVSPSTRSAGNGLPYLPPEIVLHILGFLPTASVQALRLASRNFGSVNLDTTYWLTRFDYPNELCHIRLPSTFLSKQREGVYIDWRSLCEKLFRPEPNHLGWQNRKRISLLTRRLVKRLLYINSNVCADDRRRNMDNSRYFQIVPIISDYIWDPPLSPSSLSCLSMTAATGISLKKRKGFTRMHPTIFATDCEALCHMTRVSAFLSLEPFGVYGFQFHFDDRDSIPAQADFPGNDLSHVTFLIDGPGGERISALDII